MLVLSNNTFCEKPHKFYDWQCTEHWSDTMTGNPLTSHRCHLLSAKSSAILEIRLKTSTSKCVCISMVYYLLYMCMHSLHFFYKIDDNSNCLKIGIMWFAIIFLFGVGPPRSPFAWGPQSSLKCSECQLFRWGLLIYISLVCYKKNF